ncbi:MAG: amidohydrolase family protein [Planctomycetaceae bacterium]|nr:amidohydrolase family protein [Planctomycetaceae bacterium]
MRSLRLLACVMLLLPLGGFAADDIRELKLRDWEPKSMLVTKTTIVEKPRFPVIDIHNHLGGGRQTLTPERVQRYLTEMDEAGVRTVVNLDGGWGDRLQETIEVLDKAHPGRFATFALVNFAGIDDADWSEREASRLAESFRQGARGLKIDKRLGLIYRDKEGNILPVDDQRLDAIWETCGKHQKPVVIHVSDPAAFFTPLDRFNERWHELNEHPNWLFFGDKFPKREEILAQLHRVIERHPKTTFVNTHFGNNAEDLAAVGEKLDKYPNMMVDFDARISELGRAPYSARRFFVKYQDRILFGTDTTPRRDAFRIYYRFLETDDEYFNCAASHHLQGFWMIYGLYLPDDVLEKIYHKNAERVLGLTPPPEANTKAATPSAPAGQVLRVRSTADFEITGDGKNAVWSKTEWQSLYRRNGAGLPLLEEPSNRSRVKLLYSTTGLYVLLDGADKKLTATFDRDGAHLWEEDCFEVFLWPDEKQPNYFEYEISPLGFELPLLMSNQNGKLFRWQPWSFDEERQGIPRKVRKATSITGGAKQSGADISGWTAEVFLPYHLLQPLSNVPPKPGMTWRANFYRMDHDDGRTNAWSWVPVGRSFHEIQKFGTLTFE